MPRYALKIEYHGAPFHGWQRQEGLPTVQGTIEHAISLIDQSCEGIQGAGRTDTGVHGLAQVAHVDMSEPWDTFRLSEALNYHLKKHQIAILDAVEVDPDFHARFSAKLRHYYFRLLSRRAPATHEAGLIWQIKHKLDVEAMRAGAAHLIGHHDYTTFRSTMCQAQSPVKSIDGIEIELREMPHQREYFFHIKARSFLHNQVRSIVGTLERVGAGSWEPDDVRVALEAKDRASCGPVCPAHGLYLAQVDYETDPFAQAN